MQVYQEVLEWEPPTAGLRCILEFGETTLVTQVAEPATLPPPAPVEILDQYSDLPMMPCASQDADTLHAAFHEASPSRLSCPRSFLGQVLVNCVSTTGSFFLAVPAACPTCVTCSLAQMAVVMHRWMCALPSAPYCSICGLYGRWCCWQNPSWCWHPPQVSTPPPSPASRDGLPISY